MLIHVLELQAISDAALQCAAGGFTEVSSTSLADAQPVALQELRLLRKGMIKMDWSGPKPMLKRVGAL